MIDYCEILRLQSLRNNITQITEAAHSSRNTVRHVGKQADNSCPGYTVATDLGSVTSDLNLREGRSI